MTKTDIGTPSELSVSLTLVGSKARCDAACKMVFSHKPVLAWILKGCVEEFDDCTLEEIERLIGDVRAGEIAVARGMTARSVADASSEDSTFGEGTVRYDVAFRAALPGDPDGKVGLIINVEAQSSSSPGYSLHSRAAYYCARLLSSQFGIDLSTADYGGLRRVYSIWICMNAPKALRNSVNEYRMTELNHKGAAFGNAAGADLMRIVMLCPGDPDQTDGLLRMLGLLLSKELGVDEKRDILSSEFNLPMTGELGREVRDMCNLSDGFYERGLEKGIEQGMEKGMEKGRAEGMEKERVSNIRSIMKATGLTLDKVLEMLGVPSAESPRYASLLQA